MTSEQKLTLLATVGEITDLQKRMLETLAKLNLDSEASNLIVDGSVKLTQAANKIMEALK